MFEFALVLLFKGHVPGHVTQGNVSIQLAMQR